MISSLRLFDVYTGNRIRFACTMTLSHLKNTNTVSSYLDLWLSSMKNVLFHIAQHLVFPTEDAEDVFID